MSENIAFEATSQGASYKYVDFSELRQGRAIGDQDVLHDLPPKYFGEHLGIKRNAGAEYM